MKGVALSHLRVVLWLVFAVWTLLLLTVAMRTPDGRAPIAPAHRTDPTNLRTVQTAPRQYPQDMPYGATNSVPRERSVQKDPQGRVDGPLMQGGGGVSQDGTEGGPMARTEGSARDAKESGTGSLWAAGNETDLWGHQGGVNGAPYSNRGDRRAAPMGSAGYQDRSKGQHATPDGNGSKSESAAIGQSEVTSTANLDARFGAHKSLWEYDGPVPHINAFEVRDRAGLADSSPRAPPLKWRPDELDEALAQRTVLVVLVGVDHSMPLLGHFLRHYIERCGFVPQRVLLTFNALPLAPRRSVFDSLQDLQQEILLPDRVARLMHARQETRSEGTIREMQQQIADQMGIDMSLEAIAKLREATELAASYGVTPEHMQWWLGTYTSCKRMDVHVELLWRHAVTSDREWVVEVDLDEFSEHLNVLHSIRVAEEGGFNAVRAALFDRVAEDGSLRAIVPDRELADQFPVTCDLTGAIAHGSKFKAFAYTADLRAKSGHHGVASRRWFLEEMGAKPRVCQRLVGTDFLPEGSAEPRVSTSRVWLQHYKWDAAVGARLHAWRTSHTPLEFSVGSEKEATMRFLDKCNGVCLWCSNAMCRLDSLLMPHFGLC
eukprot:TRINITY_DN13299_c0_g1_i1.p1 TRINITY_DN13299_c0_g1~~TRINITY_DN13299_c0_g1_i1.p1  ORF type:complete len:603 (+),score=103.20 TRINITY_DN13299_c0_g1_i1:20-1828(+)